MNTSNLNNISLVDAEPIFIEDIIDANYFQKVEKKRTISIINNKIDLAKKMLSDLLLNNLNTFSTKPVNDMIDILILLRS